jgi:UDPglucose 6-dehydrogenase
MGDGGPCHPRDNIALRYLAKDMGLGYDLFSAIIESREKQAKNLSIRASNLSFINNLPIVIMGESYKPDVEYTDGSYSRLIGYYLKDNVKYDVMDSPAVYVLGHRNTFNETTFPEGSIVLDPWRERKNKDTIYYGYNRE